MVAALSQASYGSCALCPRRCGARRLEGRPGRCGMSAELRVARSALHLWEEPPISGEAGSGAIFFSGCPLRCVFCQNHEISSEGFGLPVTTARLAEMMLELQAQGALNINLVTPTHFAPHVYEAVSMARSAGLALPIVCNTSGYELAETVRALAGVVDVWLTDFKYADGAMRRGIIVRHLVLPGHADDSCAVLERVWDIAGNDADLSVMNQYTPNEACRRAGGALSHGVSEEEYEIVLCRADDLGFERIWWQEGGTVSESFVPAFDATGVEGPELACPSRPQAL